MARSSPSCACWEVGHTERDFCDGQSLASAGGRWRIGVVLQTAAGVQSSATSSTSRRITARRSFSRGSLSVTLEARRSCRTALGWLETRASPRGSHGLSSQLQVVSSCHNGSHATLQWRSDVPAGSGIWMPRLPAHYRPQDGDWQSTAIHWSTWSRVGTRELHGATTAHRWQSWATRLSQHAKVRFPDLVSASWGGCPKG